MPRCTVCGREFTVRQKDAKFFDLGTPQFDRPECLQRYTQELPRVSLPSYKEHIFELTPSLAMGDGLCYSPILHMSFRSGFEVVVAETIVEAWNWSVHYEPHAFRVTEKRKYIPDFWLPSSGCWIEVKGCWHSGDKRKFLQAARIVGMNRMILLPNHYRPWFEAEAKRIRKEQGIDSICL